MAQQTPAKRLFDLLVTRNFDPETLDSSGKPATDPANAEIFSFDFRAGSGKDYGTVVIMLGDDNRLDVFGADNVGKTMEGSDKNDWFAFLQQLKIFAVKNFMSFSTRDLNRLRYSMQGQAAITEGLFESWSGRKDISWNAGATESRLVIKHKRSLGEGEARFRYVESLFVETADGERYKLPFKNLTAGKAMLEHVRMGGRPYDLRGQHISEMVNQLSLLGRFRRANQGRLLEGDTAQLVEQTNAYYENLKQSLKHLCSRTGYAKYFESWTPTEITEQEVVIEGLKHLFVTQSIDQRIEDALPIIAQIQQQENSMKEANIFEAWANRLMEGVWQLPDTPEKQAQLVELMSAELPVGADAINAKEQLYDLIGDDVLFDQLMDLADRDANADARQVIINRMQEMSEYPDIAEVMTQFTMDVDTPPEQASADSWTPERQAAAQEKGSWKGMDETAKDPADQTEDPADTEQPEYPEYQDNLADILKNAGVDDTVVRAAPDYELEVDETANPGVTPADIDGTAEETLSEFAPLAAAVGGALARGAVGAGAGALQRGAASIAGQVAGNAIGNMLGGEEVDEGRCNMTEAGEMCPTHGLKECGIEESALQGQYGHSGRMKPVEKDVTFLDRLKELSGMMRK